MTNNEAIDFDPVKEHYERLIDAHGFSSQACSWADDTVAARNFAAVSEVFAHEQEPFSVYEVGCGLGHFKDFLSEKVPLAAYKGCDIVPKMIEVGKARDADLQIEVRDILLDPPSVAADYVTISGLFNLRMGHDPDVWLEFVKRMLRAMYGFAKKGIAANFLTSHVDWKREMGYYQSPSQLLDFALVDLSRFSEIRHSYYPWEFTLLTYRAPKRLEFGAEPAPWTTSDRKDPDGRPF